MTFRWFKKTTKTRTLSARQLRRRLPFHFESLEDRSCPAGMASTTVSGLYFDVLHRQASQSEINNWNQSISQGASPGLVAQMFIGSQENLQTHASDIYTNLFGQAPSDSQLSSMTSTLQTNGGNFQALKCLQVASDAYFNSISNGNNSTWVSNVYHDVLGRAPDMGGLNFWSGQLSAGAPRLAIAISLVFSTESLKSAVNEAYHDILGRNADTGGINFWANGMQNGMTPAQLQVQLAVSAEYASQYANAIVPTYDKPNLVDSRATSATLQATDYFTTATPAIPFIANVAGVTGRAYIQIDTNNDGYFSGNELFGSSGILSTNTSSVTLQPMTMGTYNIRGLLKTITGGTITTPVTTITVDPNGGFIGSRQILQLMGDYQNVVQVSAILPSNLAKQFPDLKFDSQNRVQINVHATLPKYLDTLVASLQRQGMEVQGTYASQNMVQGWYPISGLSTIASTPHFRDITPVYKPVTRTGSVESQGDGVMQGPTFRDNTGIGGTGIKIGVLSDSVSQLGGGIADSQATGDLPAAGVQVLSDGPSGSSDEGRAMLEIIYDIAPGASLAFHTASVSAQDTAEGILELAATGSKVITDDIGYANDPMFNPGLMAQAINTVHSQGVFYDGAAGNVADQGFYSSWTSTTATVGGITGTFLRMSDGSALQKFNLQTGDSFRPIIQWDSAFLEGGAPNQPNYQVPNEIDVLFTSADGSQLIQQFNDNTLNTNEALQFGTFVNSGGQSSTNFAMAFLLKQGPAPSLLRWVTLQQSSTLVLPGGGGPTIYGKETAVGNVAVGASVWYSNQVSGTGKYTNESFSSLGGSLPILFDSNGNRLPTAQLVDVPILTAPDGVSNTFFGFPANTDDPDASDGKPRFYGTSAAAPHAAGAAALSMAQSGGTNVQVLQNMIDTALDMNDPGYDVLSGHGLIQITPFTPSSGGGGGGGGGGGNGSNQDLFESNDTSDKAANLGFLSQTSVTINSLTILTHANGLPDYDWYRATAAVTGVLTVSMNYNSKGNLHLRLYTVDANNTLILLGAGVTSGQSKQTVSAVIPQGMPILIWVYGYNFAIGAYDMTLTLA